MRIELILPWNDADLDLLKENLIGHLLMLRQLKRSPLFIATTRNEMTLVSLDNESGQVWLEWLDSGRRLTLAPRCRPFWRDWKPCPSDAPKRALPPGKASLLRPLCAVGTYP